MQNKIAVVGAGGKMGSGIALLLLLTLQETHTLTLIDQNEDSLVLLKKYLKDQLKKEAERGIIALRGLYKDRQDLVENREIIEFHVEKKLDSVFFATSLEEAKNKDLIFEAIFENVDLKSDVLKSLGNFSQNALILSNTSAIPIHYLEEKAQLKGRMAGFHFYNPPAVQKLLELIVPEESLIAPCEAIAKELGKTVVIAKDVAGFIGNGIFMREILFSIRLLNTLIEEKSMPFSKVLTTLDGITKTFLFRPMGIFQLTDYVGIDVAVNVCKVMAEFLDDPTMESPLLKQMLVLGKKGGHQGDSGQRDGFFRYEEGKPVAVFDLESNTYHPLEKEDYQALSWKVLSKEKDAENQIAAFYESFLGEDSLEASISLKYLFFERDLSSLLVKTGVAKSLEDITCVLKLGFYHLFGPTAPFLNTLENFCNNRYCP